MEIIKNTDYFVNNIKFYYYEGNTGYTGSYMGMRYRIGTNWSDRGIYVDLFDSDNAEYLENAILVARVWPEPFCYEYTKEKNPAVMDIEEFPFTDIGLVTARLWINSKYDERRREFEEASRR